MQRCPRSVWIQTRNQKKVVGAISGLMRSHWCKVRHNLMNPGGHWVLSRHDKHTFTPARTRIHTNRINVHIGTSDRTPFPTGQTPRFVLIFVFPFNRSNFRKHIFIPQTECSRNRYSTITNPQSIAQIVSGNVVILCIVRWIGRHPEKKTDFSRPPHFPFALKLNNKMSIKWFSSSKPTVRITSVK